MTETLSFKSDQEHTSLREVFDSTKKGSRKYKEIIENAQTTQNTPADTINTNWNSEQKYDKVKYFGKVFSFWKTPYLPGNLQNLHLQIINHKLKMNDQLKHFARHSNNPLVSGDCTFCNLYNIENPEEESYKHIFLECNYSRSALETVANKNRIEIPDTEEEGEK
jgi:hypothetical protein